MKRRFWLFTAMTILWMAVIFYMSAQNIESSKESSSGITTFLATIFYGKDVALTEAMLQPVSVLVRKTGHMAEYAILFLLAFGTTYFSKRFSKWGTWGLAYGGTVLYAITDEVHQLFSGRGALVQDVVIDGFGALIGVVLLFGVIRLVQSKGGWKKCGWAVATLGSALVIYSISFLLFHREVFSLFI